MKYFEDGDMVVVTKDDFVNLQESPAVFVPKDSEDGRTILERGILYLPIGVLRRIKNQLDRDAGEIARREIQAAHEKNRHPRTGRSEPQQCKCSLPEDEAS